MILLCSLAVVKTVKMYSEFTMICFEMKNSLWTCTNTHPVIAPSSGNITTQDFSLFWILNSRAFSSSLLKSNL